MEENMLTTAQVAKRYSVSRDTIRRWRNDWGLEATRVGRLYRYKLQDLLEFEKKSAVKK